jgi:hypothetical protein
LTILPAAGDTPAAFLGAPGAGRILLEVKVLDTPE